MHNKEGNIWTTERINKLLREAEDLGLDYKEIDNPFHENEPELRKGNILFQYTEEELEEMKKCASDVVYFANKYCKVMTDNGIKQILLRDYQVQILNQYQKHRKNIFVSPRQSGKTITSSILLLWYLLFNYQKNAMIMANIGDTAAELMDKIKIILKGLPFFLKPGILVYNVMTMKFDNECRVLAKTTTKTSSIGFTIHLLYMDEFAHINPNFIDSFFRSVYPTISASEIARVIITSTPNGLNKFWDIYKGALDGENGFNPIRVEWWQVPGRDEEWKRKEIASLGSEEDFNQEYGCQFLSSSRLLLDSSTLKRLRNSQEKFMLRDLSMSQHVENEYDNLIWHPKFDPSSIMEKEDQKFYISIDTAGGGGGDYSVVNIFKVSPMPITVIENKKIYDDETDFFSLLQVGIFRSNTIEINELKVFLEDLIVNILGTEQTRIVLEMDYKGELLLDKLLDSEEMYEEMFVYTKHSLASTRLKPGVKLTGTNKEKYCYDLKINAKSFRIIPFDEKTIQELSNFGINPNGTFTSQTGKDDIAMTIVNLNCIFDNGDFIETVSEIYENTPEKFKTAIEKKIKDAPDSSSSKTGDVSNYSFLNDLL
jgi:hypothetical protein